MTAEQITTTIETLTAEVRAVMIGKRQVTLSVYRQLDTIPWADIEPFGRVRDKQDDYPGIYVVGRHRTTGVLSRASIHQDGWVEDAPAAFVHWADHNPKIDSDIRTLNVAESHGRTLGWILKRSRGYLIGFKCTAPKFDEPQPEWPGPRDSYHGDDWDTARARYSAEDAAWRDRAKVHDQWKHAGEFCDMEALEREWRALAGIRVAELVPHELEYQTAEQLPLIVLAGLR